VQQHDTLGGDLRLREDLGSRNLAGAVAQRLDRPAPYRSPWSTLFAVGDVDEAGAGYPSAGFVILQGCRNPHASIELKRIVHKVSDKMRELYAKTRERSPIRLQWFLEGRDRDELIAIFLAMLELVRLGGIALQQGSLFGEILVAKTENAIDTEQFALYDK